MIVPRPGTLGRVILQILTLLVDSIKREGEWLLIYCGRSRKKVLFPSTFHLSPSVTVSEDINILLDSNSVGEGGRRQTEG
jgi:hypothetical protein